MTDSVKIRALIIFAILTSIYFLIFSSLADLDDTAEFGGDTWEYQSIAVNFAKGHGIHKFGAMESFKTYKFKNINPLPSYYPDFFTYAGNYDFLRVPGYPYLLGILYRLVGVSPSIAKALQILTLAIIASSMPFVGFYYWGKLGFVAGIPAGWLYLVANYKLADHILADSLTALSVFLIVLAYIFYERSEETYTALWLGISLGFSLLVQGSFIFLAIILLSVLLFKALKKGNTNKLILTRVVIISTLLTVLPWSIFVSSKSGRFIFLSTHFTQGNNQLLDDNNELCIVSPTSHPEWVNDKNAFYNKDGLDKKQVVLKLLNFYWQHPKLFSLCMYQKFIKGFGLFPYLWTFVVVVLLERIFKFNNRSLKLDIIRHEVEISAIRIPEIFWILGLNFLLITLVFHVEIIIVPSRYVAPMDFIFALLCCVSVLHFISNVYVNNRLRRDVSHPGRN
jgi:4-amino-4-deoxy-L-arabinose transferase-like glycosyltransferase